MKVSYSKNLKSSYMLIAIEEKYKSDYRTNMLINNSIPGFLKASERQDGSSLSLQYEITSKQPLSRIMERGNIKAEELRGLILDILRSVEGSKKYLLEEDDIVLDKDYLYVDTVSIRVGLCLLPGYNKPLDKQLRQLLLELPACMDSEDSDAVVLAYSLYSEASKEDYVLGDLIKVLSVKDKQAASKDRPKERVKERGGSLQQDLEALDLRPQAKSEEKPLKRNRLFKLPKLLRAKERPKRQPKETDVSIHVPEEFIDEDELWIEEFEREEEKGSDRDEIEPMTQFLAAGDTERKRHRILKGTTPGLEDIDIAYYPFVIGRQERISDYIIDRESVSRMHCRIDMEDGEYYIRDLNSRNGTAVNGEALINNERIRLNDGDEVQIADMVYQFA